MHISDQGRKINTPPVRQCGGCELCCRLVPVVSLKKPGGVRCRHQRGPLHALGPGCAIYHQKGFPGECALWNCRWLIDDSLDMPRPDRSHYVVDMAPDYITAQDNRPGREPVTVPVIQIWIDPHFPEAHRDPALRAWLEKMSYEGWAALIRFSPEEAMMLIPPIMSDRKQWEEIGGPQMLLDASEKTHTAEDIAAKLGKSGIYPFMEKPVQ